MPSDREALRQRILQAEKDLRTMKDDYNASAPVNRLPVEVLSDIFVETALIDAWFYNSPSEREYFSWIHLAHVCHDWREVVFNCTRLWSRIAFFDKAVTEFMLTQSKDAPLTIEYDPPRSPDDSEDESADSNAPDLNYITLKLPSQAHRIASIKSFGDPAYLSKLKGPANVLEKVELESNHGEDLPKEFLQKGAPLLKHLKIHRIAFKWSVLPLNSQLTTLDLHNNLSPLPKKRPSSNTFLETISSLPLLQTLSLVDYLPQDWTLAMALTKRAPTICPELRFLTLEDSSDYAINNFLQAVNAPKAIKSDIAFNESLGEKFVHILHGFFRAFDKFSNSGKKLGVRKLSVEEWRKDVATFYFTFVERIDCPSSKLILRLRKPTMSTCAYLRGFRELSLVDLSPLQYLRICPTFPNTYPACDWILLFGELKELATIYVQSTSIQDFCMALNNEVEEGETRAQGLAFPCLSAITLDQVQFWGHPEAPDDVEYLITTMAGRPEGHRIRKLDISECHDFRKSDYQAIKTRLPDLDVTFDGHIHINIYL
ncbi:hypothetical protein DFP72DRAFT_485172 [Ephemerocybe angulata]|uniref:F-box domain-containing protein n=1 Tax=Ephemerocybe angulata TaxID=980116 RepID=A0A8H6IGD4_9AGAR|nr:hypothetical protein DFP72DRAFT_485172 [Tulosesus angulatus]